jgi:hypothetical protein
MWGADPSTGPSASFCSTPTPDCQMESEKQEACYNPNPGQVREQKWENFSVFPGSLLDYLRGSVTIRTQLCAASLAPDMHRRVTVPRDAGYPIPSSTRHLSQPNASLHSQTLDLVAQGADLGVEVRGLVRGQGHGDDGARDTAGTAKGDLAGNVLQHVSVLSPIDASAAGTHHVGDVLLLRDQGDVEHNAEGLSISGENDQLAGAAVDPRYSVSRWSCRFRT